MSEAARPGDVNVKPRRRWRLLPEFANSLGKRLVLLFSIALLPPSGLTLYFAWDAYEEQVEQAKLSVQQIAFLAAAFERKFFDDIRFTLQRIASLPTVRAGQGGACDVALTGTLEDAPEFAGLAVYDQSGGLGCGTKDSLPSVARETWFLNALYFRRFVVSDYTQIPELTYPVIIAAQPIQDDAGKMLGVLNATIELYWLSAFLNEVQLPSKGSFFLLDREGNVVANTSLFLDNENPALPRRIASAGDSSQAVMGGELIQRVLRRELVDFQAKGSDGVSRLYSSAALPYGNVTLLFGVPTASMIGWFEQDFIARLVGLAIFWIVGIGVASFATRQLVTRWTSSLRRAALSYGRGDYSPRLKMESAPAELRDLGDTLMLMAERVEAREEALHQSLAHKDLLIKEIHHRVKNNMQIVSSLLNLRAKAVDGAGGKEALQEIKTRVRALALVHRHLYEGEDVQAVDMEAFLGELARTLLVSLTVPEARIGLKIEIPPTRVRSDLAVPIALLVVEAVSNSLKHGFPDGGPGEISITFSEEDATHGVLVVADDGVGPPPGVREGKGLGMRLIGAFTQQTGGEFSVEGPPGTAIRLRLRLDNLSGESSAQAGSLRSGAGRPEPSREKPA